MTETAMESPFGAGIESEHANHSSRGTKRNLPPTESHLVRPAKRGQYTQRACDACQRRKVRCEGGVPCSRCTTGKKECVFGQRFVESSFQGSQGHDSIINHQTSSTHTHSPAGVPADEILSRLISLERQLQNSQRPQLVIPSSISTEIPPASNSRLNLIGDQTQTFVGEMSAFHSIGSGDTESDQQHPIEQLQSQTSPPEARVNSTTEKSHNGWLSRILASHRVIPDREEFDGLLLVYFEVVHTLNPFLHRPWLEQTHEDLWQHSFFELDNDFVQNNYSKRLSIGIIFLCIACGACQESSRMDPENSGHSAGYSLYSVAMSVLQPLFDLTQDRPISFQSLQALALASLYLFRLDASGKAEEILAYAISNAHVLSLHRQSTYEKMSVYDDQMSCRIWWELYALDRRISVETGRPLVIQDLNVSTNRPLNLSDEWLEKTKGSKATCAEMANEINQELSNASQTSIPYMNSMISYGKVVSDVWKSLYGASLSPRNRHSVVTDYLDVLIDTNQLKLPAYLKYDPAQNFEQQFSNLEFWQIKHAYLVHMRYTMLKLIIRRSAFTSNSSTAEDNEDIVIQAECASIAAGIVEDYLKIPPQHPRHAFPLIHYLTSATMIMVSIVLKNPAFKKVCRNSIMLGVNTLIADCSKSWVSGKMMRTISRLTKMVQTGLLNGPNHTILNQPHSKYWEQSDARRPHTTNDQVICSSMSLPSPQSTNYIAAMDAATHPRNDWPSAHQPSPPQPNFQRPAAGSSLSTGMGSTYEPPEWSITPNTEASVVQRGLEVDNQLFSTNASTLEDLPGWVFSDFQFEQAANLHYNIEAESASSSGYHQAGAWESSTMTGYIMPFQFPPA